jgi:hypothetical protein
MARHHDSNRICPTRGAYVNRLSRIREAQLTRNFAVVERFAGRDPSQKRPHPSLKLSPRRGNRESVEFPEFALEIGAQCLRNGMRHWRARRLVRGKLLPQVAEAARLMIQEIKRAEGAGSACSQ